MEAEGQQGQGRMTISMHASIQTHVSLIKRPIYLHIYPKCMRVYLHCKQAGPKQEEEAVAIRRTPQIGFS